MSARMTAWYSVMASVLVVGCSFLMSSESPGTPIDLVGHIARAAPAVPRQEVGEREYLRAISQLAQLRSFRLEETYHFITPPDATGHYSLFWRGPKGLSLLLSEQSPGFASGPLTYSEHLFVSLENRVAIVNSLLLPDVSLNLGGELASELSASEGYSVDHVVFGMRSETQSENGKQRRLEVVTISGRGYPWLCAPPCFSPYTSQKVVDSYNRYWATLLIDPTSGLPLRFQSTDNQPRRRGSHLYEGQRVVFLYTTR